MCELFNRHYMFFYKKSLEKKSAFLGTCSTVNECAINTNMVCLANTCTCSNPNVNFWNGTYCGESLIELSFIVRYFCIKYYSFKNNKANVNTYGGSCTINAGNFSF